MTPITCGLLFYLLLRFPTVVFFHLAAWKKSFRVRQSWFEKKENLWFFLGDLKQKLWYERKKTTVKNHGEQWRWVLQSRRSRLVFLCARCAPAASRLSRSSDAGETALFGGSTGNRNSAAFLVVYLGDLDCEVAGLLSVPCARWRVWVIAWSPQIEDVFALISPQMCEALHHCMPLDPPKHLSVFPLAHPSVSHTHTQTHTQLPRAHFLRRNTPSHPPVRTQHPTQSRTQAHAWLARAHGSRRAFLFLWLTQSAFRRARRPARRAFSFTPEKNFQIAFICIWILQASVFCRHNVKYQTHTQVEITFLNFIILDY